MRSMKLDLETSPVLGVAMAVMAGCTGASADPAAPPPAQIEDPCLGGGYHAGCRRAMDHFADALAEQRAGTAARALRISYYGDSLVAGDGITGVLRSKLG